MAARNDDDPRAHNRGREPRDLMNRTSDPFKKLKQYEEELPDMVRDSPWLVPEHVANALPLTKSRGRFDARDLLFFDQMEAHLHRWRAEANLLAFEDRMDIAHRALRDAETAFELYGNLESSNGDPTDHRENLIRTALLAADACVRLHRHKKAVSWYTRAEEHCTDENTAIRADIELGRGIAHSRWDQLDNALKHLWKAHSIYQRLRMHEAVGHALHAIGRAHARVGECLLAHDFMNKAREKFQKKERSYFQVRVIADLANIACANGDEKKLKDAMGLATKASVIYQTLGDLINAAKVKATIGSIYERQGEKERAFDAYMNAYHLLDGLEDDTAHLPILRNVGRLHEERGDLHAACLVYEWALKTAEEIGDIELQYPLHNALSGVLESLGNYKQALDHHHDYVRLWQQVISERQQHELAKRQINEALRQAEEERDAANNRAEEIERELMNLTTRLEERNAMLARLEKQLKQLRESDTDADSELLDKILNDIENNRTSAEDWKELEMCFNRIYPDFANKLYEINPTITQAELDICYLAALRHKSPKIASIRGVAPGTTLDQIRGIRKKLGLSKKKVDFWIFLASLLKPSDPPENQTDHNTEDADSD